MSAIRQNSAGSAVSADWVVNKTAIHDGDLAGAVFLVGPQAVQEIEPKPTEQLFYVASGTVTVTSGDVNTMLAEDKVMRLPRDHAATVRNHSESPAKLLLLELPPPRIEYMPVERVLEAV